MKKFTFLASVASVASVLAATDASAIQYEWSFSSGSNAAGTKVAACGPDSSPTACQMTFTSLSGSEVMKARAYSTPTASSSDTAPGYSGNFLAADIYKWGGSGLGIGNRVSGDANDCIGSCNPEHSVDNQQVYDVMVFEAPNAYFDFEALSIGWYNNDSDMRIFVGGNDLGANFDFTGMCFTGCGSSIMGSSAWTDLGTISDFHSASGGTKSLNTTATGRYLVVSGALGQKNDYFKIDGLKGTQQTPEPQTLALLIGGLAIMGTLARNRRSSFPRFA